MATTNLTITVSVNATSADVTNRVTGLAAPDTASRLATLLEATAGGSIEGKFEFEVGSAYASQTVTCDQASAVDGTDDITIGSVTLSVEASPSGENQFDSGSTDAEFATNLAAAINGHSTLGDFLTATASAAVVTITSNTPGAIGNEIALAETGNGMTLGAAALAGGTGGNPTQYGIGLQY